MGIGSSESGKGGGRLKKGELSILSRRSRVNVVAFVSNKSINRVLCSTRTCVSCIECDGHRVLESSEFWQLCIYSTKKFCKQRRTRRSRE
jgi:hypothetical protein